jgi:sulfopyruvate decarboxylase alpha subunit
LLHINQSAGQLPHNTLRNIATQEIFYAKKSWYNLHRCAMTQSDTTVAGWKQDIFDALKAANVQQVFYVPDAGHAHVIESCERDPDIRAVALTTEEEGVAMSCGAWLGGQRSVLLMQSSGVGNCVNMFSLLQSCRIPFLTLVTMRGEYAEFNPWQVTMSKATETVMTAMGIRVLRVCDPDEVQDTVEAALDAVFGAGEQVAILISQKLIGRKKWTR